MRKIAKKLSDANEANESSDTDGCVQAANYILATEHNHLQVRFLAYQLLCKCYRNEEHAALAVSSCMKALEITRDAEILCDSVEAYLNAEMFDDGNVTFYYDVHKIDIQLVHRALI